MIYRKPKPYEKMKIFEQNLADFDIYVVEYLSVYNQNGKIVKYIPVYNK